MDEEKDVEIDADDDGAGVDAETKVKKLRAELGEARIEAKANLDGWQRAKADYVNLLKRGNDEAKLARGRGVTDAVTVLFPAFDALERAKEHGDLPTGFEAIARQLETAFAGLGLESTGKVAELFDPVLHEALVIEKVETKEADNHITELLEKGWRIGDTVLRPAKVKVGKFE
jgi:molecular chaperone GrpE